MIRCDDPAGQFRRDDQCGARRSSLSGNAVGKRIGETVGKLAGPVPIGPFPEAQRLTAVFCRSRGRQMKSRLGGAGRLGCLTDIRNDTWMQCFGPGAQQEVSSC